MGEKPGRGDDSLDFTDTGHAQAGASPRATAKPAAVPSRKAPGARQREPASGTRRAFTLALIVVAAAVVAVLATTNPSPNESKPAAAPSTSAPPATSTPPSPERTPPKAQSPTIAPAPPRPAPPQARSPEPPAIPAEIKKAFEEYGSRAGGKAMALALAADGRYAYSSVSGFPTQDAASEDALIECERYKTQSAIPAPCRLYAVGDKVVWPAPN